MTLAFVRLTRPAGDPVFVKIEHIAAFGPSAQIPPSIPQFQNTWIHNTWIHLHGDSKEIYVQETYQQILALFPEHDPGF